MIQIGTHSISPEHKPFIIAEMSGNHNQSLERGLKIIEAAANSGAHAIKLQTYTADTITLNSRRPEFLIQDKNSLWYGRNLYELYQEAYTPWEWHKPMFEYAKKLGITIFSSPFDTTAVDFLETLDVPCYKIASFENTDHILLKKVAQTGKPIIMSTGIVSLEDLLESVDVLKTNGCKDLILLKCTSSYPASPENTNINTIPDLATKTKCIVGLSDHTMGIGVSIASVALGARVIEKHFTLSRAEGGVDSAFSMEPHEMKMLVTEAEKAFLGLGKINYTLTDKEITSLSHKRSLYVIKPMKKGDVFSEDNIRSVRPANGLPTKYYWEILGKKATVDIEINTPLDKSMIETQ